MKLLITGSAGFIGSHAFKAALARGWEVSSIDTRATASYRRVDARLLTRIEADVVLHLAAYSSNAGFADHLSENYSNNVGGMLNVLTMARNCGARVVYASSSAVYGNPLNMHRAPEHHWNMEIEPLCLDDLASHYAKSKLMCELMAASFPNTLGLRIFNAYGPGDECKATDRQAPPTWMRTAKERGEPIVIYGDGTQAKDFIHVSDVVEIIMRLIESDAAGIVNVGTGVAMSFNDLAAMISGPVEHRPIPDPASYQHFTRADCTRLDSIIGKYICMSVGAGIEVML